MKKFYFLSLIFSMTFAGIHAQQISKQPAMNSKAQNLLHRPSENRYANDTLWVNDTILTYHAMDGEWVLFSRFLVTERNDIGNPVTNLYQIYDADKKSWINIHMDSTFYYNKTVFKENRIYVWDGVSGKWIFEGYKSQTEDGRLLENASLVWSSESQHYSFGYKEIHTYYPDLRPESVITQNIDPATGDWIQSGLTSYYYFQNGDDSLTINFSWDFNINDWLPVTKSLFEHQPEENLTIITGYTWDKEQQEWNPVSQNKCYHRNEVTDSVIYAYRNNYYQEWYNSKKTVYQHDQNGNITDITYQTYYPGEEKWYNERHLYYIYNEDNKFVDYGEQLWDLTAKRWNDHFKYLTSYENGQITSFEYRVFNSQSQNYTALYRYEYYYDFRNNLDYTLSFFIDGNGDLAYNSKGVHIWSPFTTPNAVAETKEKMFSVYPNPSKGTLHIVGGTMTGSAVQIQLTDMQGKVHLSKILYQNNETLDIREIPAGMYIMRLTTDNKTEIIRVIIE